MMSGRRKDLGCRLEKQRFLIVDDHDIMLQGTQGALQQQYHRAEFITVSTASQARDALKCGAFDLVIADLSIPETFGEKAQSDVGIDFLRELLVQYPTLNIVVLSSFTKTLIRLKPDLITHEGGLAVVDKSISSEQLLLKVDWALQGVMFTPNELRRGVELKPEWVVVMRLAFQEGLQDSAIAKRMHLSIRTVRNYWTRLQDALGVYPERDKNIRIQTEIQARALGLID